jgi:hypothetical protein
MYSKIAERSLALVTQPAFGASCSSRFLGQRREERLGDGVVKA